MLLYSFRGFRPYFTQPPTGIAMLLDSGTPRLWVTAKLFRQELN